MSCSGMVEKYFTALKFFQGFIKNLLCGWTAKYDELNDRHRAGNEREPNFYGFFQQIKIVAQSRNQLGDKARVT